MKDADNQLLTRVGPGTPMGELLRCYWVPAFLSEEIGDRLSDPHRFTLLGETMVAFRDEHGTVAVLEEHCAHRCASLYFGRNEPGGLRCIYHGWKFDGTGQCVDQPSEPSTSRFKERIGVRSYPCQERAGIVWVFMGAADSVPGLPELEWLNVPAENVFVSKRLQESNYLQAIEGGIDSSHVSVLHQDTRRWHHDQPTGDWDRTFSDSAPRFFVEPTEYGMAIGARRDADDDHYYWRVTQWLLPWYSFVPRDRDRNINAHAWVPIDDTTTWTWSITYHPDRPLTRHDVDSFRGGSSIHAELIPGTHVPVRNRSNEYLVDRKLQRLGYFSGIEGIPAQDSAVQESMGAIVDRRREHLGTSDVAIVYARRRLLAAVRAHADGQEAPALDPEVFRIRSTAMVLPRDASWTDAAGAACRVG